MHGLLTKLLRKRGIETANQLSDEEKQTFENWQLILNKEELTVEDIKMFCSAQIKVIEGKWADFNLEQSKKAELIPYHTCYAILLAAISSPRSARESLEIQLNQLIK
jgi:hypothetical protein